MFVSLVMPTYNQVNRLIANLCLINLQSFNRDGFEVIVVDDGTEEDLKKKVSSLEINYDLKLVTHGENLGRSVARNTGVVHSKGDLLVFSDSDRILDRYFIQEHVRFHEIHIDAVVVGCVVELFLSDFETEQLVHDFSTENPSLWRMIHYFNYGDCVTKMYTAAGETDSNVPWITLFSGNCSVRKSSFNQVGGYDTNFREWGFENLELGYRLHKAHKEFYYNRNALNYHIYHSSNREGASRDENWRYFCGKHTSKTIERIIDFLEGRISLQELDALEGTNESAVLSKQPPIYFEKRKLGSRYKHKKTL